MKFLGMNIGADGGSLKEPKDRKKGKEVMEFRAPVEPILDQDFVDEVKGVRQQVGLMKQLTKQFARDYAFIRNAQAEIAATLAALFKEVKRADFIELKATNSVNRDAKQYENKVKEETTRHDNAIKRIDKSHQNAMGAIAQSHNEAMAKLEGSSAPQVNSQQPKRKVRTFLAGLFR